MCQLIPPEIQEHLRILRYPTQSSIIKIKQSIIAVLKNLGYNKDVSEKVANDFCSQYTSLKNISKIDK